MQHCRRTTAGLPTASVALEEGHESIAMYLIESGANPDLKDPATGQNLAMQAAARGSQAVLLDLIARNVVSGHDLDDAGRTTLHLAVLSGLSAASVEALVEAGCDPGVQDR